MNELAVFFCGPPKDHECDSDGPVRVGGEDENGNFWSGPNTPENRKRATWGSVTCSKCKMSAMELDMWRGE